MEFEILEIKDDPGFDIIEFVSRCVVEANVHEIGANVDPEVSVFTLHDFAVNPDKLFLAAKSDDKIIGIFLGEIRLHPFTKLKIGVELYWSVIKEWRRYGVGKALFERFASYLKEHQVDHAICGVNEFTTKDSAPGNDFLQSLGFVKYHTSYIKRI